MATRNAGEAAVTGAHLGELPGGDAQSALHAAMVEAVVLAGIKGHSAVQPVTLGPFHHADQTGAVIQTVAGTQNFVENVDRALVSEHGAERLTPGPLETQRVLLKLAAAGLADPEFFDSHAALDAGYFTAKGCEATMWGPGEIAMFHTSEESVLVDEVWDIANAYLGTIESYLG